MNDKNRSQFFAARGVASRFKVSALAGAICAVTALPAQAFMFDTGNRDLRVRWDTNIKYTAGWRLQDQDAELVADPNLDDGDRNFDQGEMIFNRADLFTEFDVDYNGTGLRVSGAAWYDQVYNSSNDNDSPQTVNSYTVPYNEFTDETQELHGKDAEIRDAFVYSDFNVTDEMWGVVRAGQHSLLYGESLFFGNNGIAGGQLPIDAIRALSVPNSQFKELALPVGQVSGELQLTQALSVGAYYQYEWERTRIPAAGSYFSPADLLDGGGERILAGPGASFYRGSDYEGSDSGQYGMRIRYRADDIGTEFGLYATRYHDKNFQVQVRPYLTGPVPGAAGDAEIGEYMLLFPEEIEAYGFSVNTGIGNANVGFEASTRRNAPLVSLTVTDLTGVADNDDNALYAVGNTAHAQVNMINILPTGALWDTAALLGELAWNRTLSISENPESLDPNTTRDATAVKLVFTPTYFQVMDGVDMDVPMGISYGIDGRSSAVGGFSQEKGGNYNIGASFNYRKRVTVSLSYNGFYGPSAPVNINGIKTFKQTNADRDFISLNASYTF